MIPDTITFEQFFAEKIKERGISLKKLADATGIAPAHIETLLRGDFESMPSAPYFRGYLVRLGNELGFDGEEWWLRFKKEGVAKKSGAGDALPHNRFIKAAPPKWLWAVGVGIVIIIYFALQAPRIFGTPTLTVTFPDQNPYVTLSSTITLTGTVHGADSLYLVGSNGETEQIIMNPDGTWSKAILLGVGPNPIEIAAKKFLGGETDVTENVFYQGSGSAGTPPGNATSTPSSTIPANIAPGSSTATGSPVL
jgi:transcriptional regulator with XRE-family HTH domain